MPSNHGSIESTKSRNTPSPQPSSSGSKKSSSNNKVNKKPNNSHDEEESSFNGEELIQYLSQSYQQYLQQAKHDKQGETIKIYKSLDASTPWKSSTNATSTGHNGNKKNNNKNSSSTTATTPTTTKDVIRYHSNSSLDILFEVNRSIYQSQH